MHRGKTAALFRFAVEAAGLAADATAEVLNALRDYARNLGLAYQITDDLLSASGTEPTGKDAGLDHEKITAVKVCGVEGAIRRTRDLVHAAVESLRKAELPEERLGAIAEYVLARSGGNPSSHLTKCEW